MAKDSAKDSGSPDGGAGPGPAEGEGARPRAEGAAWGRPFVAFQDRWTRLEIQLITFALAWQLLSLVAWVVLVGLAARPAADSSAGTVFRSAFGAVALGSAAWGLSRKQKLEARRAATIAAVFVGLALGPAWRSVGVPYFDNIKGWLQEGSTLTMMGGLRGLATRLTLWLALLGGSLATGLGKHIHVDLVVRFLPKPARKPVALANYFAAAAVCAAASWGFFDFNAIQSYDAKSDMSPGAKLALTVHEAGDHFFLLRRQIGLDLKSLPHVLGGQPYDSWMSNAEWNEWAKGGGFESRWSEREAATLYIDGPGTHPTLVVSPTGKTARGCLVQDLNLVFPFGLLAIALRFLLRAILTISGHVSADPEEAVKEEIAELSRGEDEHEAPAATEGGA